MKPKNRFHGIESASLWNLAGRYDIPIPNRFLASIDCLKIPAQDSSIPFKTSFGHNLSIEQSQRDVFLKVIQNSFTIFYGPSDKCKAL